MIRGWFHELTGKVVGRSSTSVEDLIGATEQCLRVHSGDGHGGGGDHTGDRDRQRQHRARVPAGSRSNPLRGR